VAALAYARRKHLINVFLWPTGHGPDAGPVSANRQGYHLLHWTQPDYTYWVVSDLGIVELKEFAGLLRGADSATAIP
jgi:anti-sigma factor RsiW